jgi:hypothetical protein
MADAIVTMIVVNLVNFKKIQRDQWHTTIDGAVMVDELDYMNVDVRRDYLTVLASDRLAAEWLRRAIVRVD